MERGHAEALLPLVERVIAAVPGGFASIDRVAVTAGPGSFTGIRIGLAVRRPSASPARSTSWACRRWRLWRLR